MSIVSVSWHIHVYRQCLMTYPCLQSVSYDTSMSTVSVSWHIHVYRQCLMTQPCQPSVSHDTSMSTISVSWHINAYCQSHDTSMSTVSVSWHSHVNHQCLMTQPCLPSVSHDTAMPTVGAAKCSVTTPIITHQSPQVSGRSVKILCKKTCSYLHNNDFFTVIESVSKRGPQFVDQGQQLLCKTIKHNWLLKHYNTLYYNAIFKHYNTLYYNDTLILICS